MKDRYLVIEPIDPLIFRDGKPFGDGLPAKTMPFPLPATTAGAIRTRSGEDIDFADDNVIKRLLAIRQIGPFLVVWDEASSKWEVCLTAPADSIPYQVKGEGSKVKDEDKEIDLHVLKPDAGPLGGCDLPGGLQPLFGAKDEKVSKDAAAYWRPGFLSKWLTDARHLGRHKISEIGHAKLPTQKRIHVAIDPNTRAAKDHMLFSTDGLEFQWKSKRAALLSKITGEDELRWPGVAPIGGERRLAIWRESTAEAIEWPVMPPSLNGRVRNKLIRVVLATPAYFEGGWKPAWCQTGIPPGTKDLTLKLVAAAVPRFQPASGWDLRVGKNGAPKATRFLTPAGSVYFFEATGDVSQLWLHSISDGEQDQKDGYGIVVVGDH